MANNVTLALLLFILGTAVEGGEWCFDSSKSGNDSTFWCDDACCEDSLEDKYCCSSGNAGMIIGIVIGCLVLIGIVIFGLIICFGEYHCLRRLRGR